VRIAIYSHDTFGVGNIRRVLAICRHLNHSIPEASILIVTGSPMLQSFRIPEGIDYIKLPCLKRDEEGNLAPRCLRHLELKDVVDARRDLLFAAIRAFRPDLLLVDKKPAGLCGELMTSIVDLKLSRPRAKIILVLRDILDSPSQTHAVWKEQRHAELVEAYYDHVLVLGTRDVFDVCAEYQLPRAVRRRVEFCGYIRREPSAVTRAEMRHEWGIAEFEPLVLVTTGGGEDGYELIRNYILGLRTLSQERQPWSVVITGPELRADRQSDIRNMVAFHPRLKVVEFTDDMMAALNAADVVVSMAGYNTICEILSLGKHAVVVPRTRPVAEQWIRAERMSSRGLFRALHPNDVTPALLMDEVSTELAEVRAGVNPQAVDIDMNALPRIADLVCSIGLRREVVYQPALVAGARF